MKFFADENLEESIVEAVRELGHDVATVPAEGAGTRDEEVLARSSMEQRILVTNDKDFAELTFLKRQATAGVVLVRLPHWRSRAKAARVREVVEIEGERLFGVMTVVEEAVIRRRAFPPVGTRR